MNIRKIIEQYRAKAKRDSNYRKEFNKAVAPKVDAAYYKAKEKAMIKEAEVKATQPSTMVRLAQGLANHLNKQKTKVSNSKLSKSKNQTKRIGQNLGKVNQGSTGLQFGGSGINTGGTGLNISGNGFNAMGSKPLQYGGKGKSPFK